jgi:cell division protein FtsB
MNKNIFSTLGLLALLVLAGGKVWAQDGGARAQRDLSLQMSRYDAVIAKLAQQNERLMQEVRELQRQQDRMEKLSAETQKAGQKAQDDLVNFRNTEVENIKNSQWGEGRRNCEALAVSHQQIKMTVSPDGKEGLRYLCFDGKPLLLGSEKYTLE